MGWIAAGVGAATAIGGAIAGGVALSKEGELVDSCEDEVCTDPGDVDVRDAAADAALAADILLPTGGALVAAGVVMILVGMSGDEDEGGETARVGVAPALGAGTAGVLIEGRF